MAKDPQQKEADEQLKQLQFYYEKTLQAYRIRMKCLNRRHEILEAIAHDFNRLPENPNIYSELQSLVSHEWKVLGIITKEGDGGVKNIDFVLSELNKIKKNTDKSIFVERLIKLKDGTEISGNEIIAFLDDMMYFIIEFQKDINKIESRLSEEGVFLASKGRDKVLFDKFIKAWDEEIRANKRLLKLVSKTLKRNSTLCRKIARPDDSEKFLGSFLRGLGGGIGGVGAVSAYAAMILGNVPASASFFLVSIMLGSVVFLGGIASSTSHVKKSALQDASRDQQLIEQVEKIENIKKPFWNWFFKG